MRASVTQPFDGVVDGEIYGRRIEVGEEINGDLAAAAVGAGWAVDMDTTLNSAEIDEKTAKTVEKTQISSEIDEKNAEKTALQGEKSVVLETSERPALTEIPADWKSMKWFALKALAEKIAGREVKDSDDAKALVEAEVSRRNPQT